MHPLSNQTPAEADDFYPESDGAPMADNTEQFDWIVKLKENLEIRFADDPNVFVAGNLFWYPDRDRMRVPPLAPDAMVVFGRPKGPRGSYKQWEEGGIAPQVAFEVRSPCNTRREMDAKRAFYETHGVEEYYVYDPERNRFEVWLRQGGRLRPIAHLHGWVSPRLGIRFALTRDTLEVSYPDGRPFRSPVELARWAEAADRRAAEERERAEAERLRAEVADRRAEEERRRAAAERQQAEAERRRAEVADRRAEEERQRAEAERERAETADLQAREERRRTEDERQRADAERQRAERLAARLRLLGLDPDGV